MKSGLVSAEAFAFTEPRQKIELPTTIYICGFDTGSILDMANTSDSGSSTPNVSRFTSQAADVEDRLKADTVGLVTLNDFRKRRAEVLAQDESAPGSGTATPDGR